MVKGLSQTEATAKTLSADLDIKLRLFIFGNSRFFINFAFGWLEGRQL